MGCYVYVVLVELSLLVVMVSFDLDISCLFMIRLHCCNVFCVRFWYLSVGSFLCKWKLCARNVCTFFGVLIGIDDYCCLALVGLSEHCILCYKFLIQLFYNM